MLHQAALLFAALAGLQVLDVIVRPDPRDPGLVVRRVIRIEGEPSEELGTSVCALGDVDEDGCPDLAVGGAWQLRVFSGASLKEIWRRGGIWTERGMRAPVSIGDLDGDGVGDLAVGYPSDLGNNDSTWSRIWVLSGRDGRVLHEILGEVDPDRAGANDHLGWGVAAAGDLDADGVPDLFGGAPFGPLGGGRGRVTLFSGATGLPLQFVDAPAVGGAGFGEVLVSMGDVDGDGHCDVAIGGSLGETRIHVVSGFSLEVLHRRHLALDAGFELVLVNVGDWDADGVDDLAAGVGEPRGEGTVIVMSGRDFRDLARFRGSKGSVMGRTVSGVPDLDGNGFSEFALGAIPAGPWTSTTGDVAVLSGSSGALHLWLRGDRLGSRFGTALTAADLNGDGSPELVVGAPGWDPEHWGGDYWGYVDVVSIDPQPPALHPRQQIEISVPARPGAQPPVFHRQVEFEALLEVDPLIRLARGPGTDEAYCLRQSFSGFLVELRSPEGEVVWSFDSLGYEPREVAEELARVVRSELLPGAAASQDPEGLQVEDEPSVRSDDG